MPVRDRGASAPASIYLGPTQRELLDYPQSTCSPRQCVIAFPPFSRASLRFLLNIPKDLRHVSGLSGYR